MAVAAAAAITKIQAAARGLITRTYLNNFKACPPSGRTTSTAASSSPAAAAAAAQKRIQERVAEYKQRKLAAAAAAKKEEEARLRDLATFKQKWTVPKSPRFAMASRKRPAPVPDAKENKAFRAAAAQKSIQERVAEYNQQKLAAAAAAKKEEEARLRDLATFKKKSTVPKSPRFTDLHGGRTFMASRKRPAPVPAAFEPVPSQKKLTKCKPFKLSSSNRAVPS